MIVLLLLKLFILFCFAEGPQAPVDTPSSSMEVMQKASVENFKLIRQSYGLTPESQKTACKNIQDRIMTIAGRNGWLKGSGVIEMSGSKLEYYKVFNCDVAVSEIKGKLSGSKDLTGPTTFVQGLPGKQEFKLLSDLNVFKVLLQILMYVAGAFWTVRTIKDLIAGDFYGGLVNFLQGLLMVSAMFVVYRLM